MNYYNEFDPKAAAWLRELIAQGHIPDGWVDERSIHDVRPHELTPFTQHHFFAGIGGWSLALRLAGWPEDKPVRTGSCPCQPFSTAGRGLGTKDPRHLWPVFRDLITFGEPTVTFGEQVASKAGREWLDGIRSDLEGLGYEVGAADLCAAGVNAPHIRQRLYWMANPHMPLGDKRTRSRKQPVREQGEGSGWMEHAKGDGRKQRRTKSERGSLVGGCGAGGMGDTGDQGSQGHRQPGRESLSPGRQGAERHPAQAGFWGDYDLAPCRDGKARRIEPGSFPLAHGIPSRVGLLRGYGNAIVPQLAAVFIRSAVEAITHPR